jgi:hypothetical protein
MNYRTLLALPLLCAAAMSQTHRFDAVFRQEVTYPTLTPRYVLRLDLGDWNGTWAGFPDPQWRQVKTSDLAKDPSLARFTRPYHDPARYYVRRQDTERIPVERIDFPRCTEQSDFCEPGGPDYFSVYLVLDPTRLRAQDKVTVFLLPPNHTGGPDASKNPASNEVTLPDLRRVQVILDPSYVPSQELTNGRKRPVAHLGAGINIDRIGLWRGFARSYVRAESILSTDAKDKASKVEARWMVLERALPGPWYLPVHLETKVLGNQTADNVSSVTSAGISGLIPWRWTRKAFYGDYFQIPVSPIWRFSAQHEYRARQTVAAAARFPDANAFRMFGEMSWSPIRLLPSPGSDTLTLEMLGRGWYFPRDRNALGQRIERLEGYFEVSVLVPITKFQFTGSALVSDDASKAKQRIRIKYSVGANEANAFLHSSQISLGVEIIK